MEWFLACLDRAVDGAQTALSGDIHAFLLRSRQNVVVGVSFLTDLRRHAVKALRAIFGARQCHVGIVPGELRARDVEVGRHLAVSPGAVPRFLQRFEEIYRRLGKTDTILSAVLGKARFWESIAGISLNERQKMMLNHLLDGFEGKLTNAKWAKLAKCSADTALRDLQYLVDHGILIRGPEGGRSTSYTLTSRS